MPDAAAVADETWTIERILRWTQDYFSKKNILSARLDAEVLLAHTLHVDRVYLYTHYDRPLSKDEREQMRSFVRRRADHEPVAYIVGEKEFYSRAFAVSPATLIPRPETEHIVETVVTWAKSKQTPWSGLDIGTGSGALAVTLAAEQPASHWLATDISDDALAIARGNAQKHGVEERVSFAPGNLWDPVERSVDVLVSNPPYVESDAELPADVKNYEPLNALFAGPEGLDVLQPLLSEAHEHLLPGGLLAVELGMGQMDAAEAMLSAYHYTRVERISDLAGIERVLSAIRIN